MARGKGGEDKHGEKPLVDWVSKAADDAIRHAGPDAQVVTCRRL